jgi:hypothetical protein
MGDKITLKGLEVIQSGVLQLDFKNEDTGKMDRCFVTVQKFFEMFGNSMHKAHIEYVKNFLRCVEYMEAEGWVKDEEN